MQFQKWKYYLPFLDRLFRLQQLPHCLHPQILLERSLKATPPNRNAQQGSEETENALRSKTTAGTKSSSKFVKITIEGASKDSLNTKSFDKLPSRKPAPNPFAPAALNPFAAPSPIPFAAPAPSPALNLFARRASVAGSALPSFPTSRPSLGAPGRRGSIVSGGQTRQMFDEDQLRYFWANRGITIQDIDTAFNMLSQDKQKLTHSDIKQFVSKYFDSFPEEAMTVLNSWKEEVTKAQLEDVLLNKQLMSSPYESAFKWFQPENGSLNKAQLRRIAKNVSSKKMAGKGDVKAILAKYDNDRDNVIGLEDFKKMGLY